MRSRTTKLLLAAAAGGALVAGPLFAAGPAFASSADATVTVVHGVPGVPVDVYVNGKLTLPKFQPDTVTQPLELPAGTYDIAIRKAGAPSTAGPIISGSATLVAGENASLVANLTTSGTPTLSVFENDTSTIPAGDARLVVRHVADAPAVDVLANGKVAFSDLVNGQQAMATLPAGTITAAVNRHGTSTTVLGPTSLDLAAGSETIVYAVGSASAHTLTLLTQTISGLGPAPSAVVTGNTDPVTQHVLPLAALAAVVVVGAGIGGLSIRRLRTRGEAK